MIAVRTLKRTAVVALMAAGAAVWYACSDRTAEPLTGPTPQLNARGMGPDLGAAIAAQDRHTEALLKIPGVVGTAVGVQADGRPAVQVLVERSGIAGLPAVLDGIPVAVQVTGRFMAFSDPTTRQRPAPMGYSVGHPQVTAGSIGARVRDAAGQVYVLSNNHVLANQNNASIGDPEYQPGVYDGGTAADQIATLSAFQTITFTSTANNTIDAAIALSNTVDLANFTPTDDAYGMPSANIYGDANHDGTFDDRNALLGLNVQKYGRTTRLTHGQITGVNATVTICYAGTFICTKSARFVDQLIITPGTFSGGGDSGSLIVTDDGNKNPVALLFAGSTSQTIANRIDLVLNRFGVSIDGSVPAPVTDVAVTSVGAPASVVQGSTVNVTVTVQNVGNQDVSSSFDVTLQDATDNVAIGTQTLVGVAAGASSTLTFSWNTTGSSIGSHSLVGSHTLTDDNAANNQASATVAVNTALTDVAVTAVNAPATVTQGSTINVGVTVGNVGNQDVGSFDVTLQDATDNVTLGTQTVGGLAAGASSTRNFSWNTTGASIGGHTLVATHSLTDDNAANNQRSATVTVNPPSVNIHIGDLDATTSSSANTWSATVEVTVHDANHNPLNGATVRGTWSPSGLNSNECTTGDGGGNGTCIMLYPSIRKSTKSVSFTVNSVTRSGNTYQPSANHDPDGSSNGTTIIVNQR